MPFSHQCFQLLQVYMASSRAIPGHSILGHIATKRITLIKNEQ